MDAYYINMNTQENGENIVHKSTCSYVPGSHQRIFLGYCNNCQDAIKEAKKTYPLTANGCKFCCPECHKK
jgi:hypothetical protein